MPPPPPDKSTLIEQAETRTKEANLRTDQANTRMDEANTRTEQANTRMAEANARTEQADLRTEKAEARTETLHESELNYRRLFESARDGILILDATTGRITDVNPFLIELLGYSHGEMIGKTVGELSPFKDILSNQAMLARLQKDGYIRYEDLPLETRDGCHVSVEFVSNVYQAGDKKVIQCNIRDITERKRTEAVMSASEARYRRLFESAKDGILILNAATGRIVDVNPFLAELLADAREAFIGKHLWELGFFKDIAANEAHFKELQAKDYIRYDDLPLETSDGRRIDVEFVSNAYLVDGHRVMQCNIRDITESKAAAMGMSRLGAIVEFSDDAIMGKDLDGIITSWNKGAEKIFGYTAAEMVGTSIMRLIPADRREEEIQILGKINRGEHAGYLETLRQTKGGRLVDVSVTVSPIKNAAGKVVGVSKILRDVTVAKEREREIVRLSRLYAALSQINQAIIWKPRRAELFEDICRVLVENGKFSLAWVGLPDVETRQVCAVAKWGDNTDYLSRVKIYADDRLEGWGPTGTAIREGRSEVCNDFVRDPNTVPSNEPANRAGFRAVAAFPIRENGAVIGALTVYSDETGFFQDQEIALLEEAAADISFALDNLARDEARKRAERALQFRNVLLSTQQEVSIDGILVVDENNRILSYNHRFVELWGVPAKLIEAQADEPVLQFVANQTADPQSFLHQVQYLYEHRQETSREEIILADDRVFDRFSAPMFGSEGKYFGRVWFFRDYTERKRAEASNARLAMAVEQAAESVVITDTVAKILYVNPAFEKNSGYPCAEVLGQNSRILKSGRQDATFYRQMWNVLGRGENWHGHFVNKRKDGTLFEEEATISPVRDATGKVVNYVAVKRDVTREMQFEAQSRQSQKMEAIGTLAGGVAHDFNNIHSIIQMQVDLLKSDGDLSAAQSELANDIGIAIQRAVGLTRQLLLFSRKEVRQSRDLDLSDCVSEMTKMLKRTLGENIVVQLKLAAQPMFLHADAGMMDQVLMNLAVNARDAMPNGGQLVIETAGVEFDEFAATQTAQARPGSFVRLSVSDNGCGIPPEHLARIFEPFFTTKAVGKGTGLGLATVFGIAQQHQGWVNVYSEVGHGTTFKVYLPRLSEMHDTKFIEKMPATAQTGHETILLVEDEPSLRTMIGKSLSRHGYRVLDAATGVNALKVWKEHPGGIHVLLTDLMMPDGMTGRELGQRLLQENPRLKVIYMSGYSPEIVAKDFPLQAGVNFLTKPFQVQQLAQIIRQSLDAPT